MAMSKEDQRADRIMAKEPLSERERVTYERLRKFRDFCEEITGLGWDNSASAGTFTADPANCQEFGDAPAQKDAAARNAGD